VITPLKVEIAGGEVLRRPARRATLPTVEQSRLDLADHRGSEELLRGKRID